MRDFCYFVKDKEWEGITVKRGQLVTSREHLAEELKKGVQKVRTALKKLESTNDIVVEPTNQYTLITIIGYDQMQGDGNETNQLVTSNQPSNNQPVTTTKEIKRMKEEIHFIKRNLHLWKIIIQLRNGKPYTIIRFFK